jgi:competence protein ComEA
MDAAPSSLGVAAETPVPPPTWPGPERLAPAKDTPNVSLPPGEPPGWPRSAQCAIALLLLLALGLLGWHVVSAQRWGVRPTTLEADAVSTSRIDLNRADRAQLLQLPSVGETLARRIEAYRQEHNGFRSVEELRRVAGIGPAVLERLRPLVDVEPYEDEEDREPPSPVRKPPAAPAGSPSAVKKVGGQAGPIDINRATTEELQRLPGIGPKLSARIVETRALGLFQSVDELRRVPGIGAKTLEKLRPLVTVGNSVAKGPEQ